MPVGAWKKNSWKPNAARKGVPIERLAAGSGVIFKVPVQSQGVSYTSMAKCP